MKKLEEVDLLWTIQTRWEGEEKSWRRYRISATVELHTFRGRM